MSNTETALVAVQKRNHPNLIALIERQAATGQFVPCDCPKCRQPKAPR